MTIDDKPQLSKEEAEMALAAYLAPWVSGDRVCWDLPGGGEGLAYLERSARTVDRLGVQGPTDWWISRVPAGEGIPASILARLDDARSVALLVAEDVLPGLRKASEARFKDVRVLALTAWRAVGLVELGATPEGVAFDDSLAGAPGAVEMVLLAGSNLSALDPYVVVALPLVDHATSPKGAASGASSSTVAAASSAKQVDADMARLERRLQGVARRAEEAARERDRVAGLLRDLALSPPFVSSSSVSASSANSSEYAQRAAAAEASREQARYHASELATSLRRAKGDLAQSASYCASLEGRSRGLGARLAEVEEMREMAEAQLALAREDAVDAEGQELRLERSLAEARESVEMAVVREHGAPRDAAEPGVGAQLAEITARQEELEAQAQELGAQRDHARGENLRLLALVGTMENAAEGMRVGHRRRVAELLADALHQEQEQGHVHGLALAVLRGELAGVRARLADREASASDRTTLDELRARLNEALDETDAMRAEVLELRAVRQELTLRAADLSASAESRGARAADLASSVAARDALVERLQLDLVEEEQISRRREESWQRAEAECGRLRDAVLRAAEVGVPSSYPPARIDEYEQTQIELERQLSELRHGAAAERASAVSERVRAEEAAARCASTEGALGAERQRVAELTQELDKLRTTASNSRTALQEARELLAALADAANPDAERRVSAEITAVGTSAPGADDDTLMRTLTAQLEERNERIRGLEARLVSSDRTGERLALEETVAKLRADLAAERAARAASDAKAGDENTRAEMETLRQTLRDRYADMLRARSQVEGVEAQASALRGALAETRGGLESLLGDATATGDTATADRVGALLRLLGRF